MFRFAMLVRVALLAMVLELARAVSKLTVVTQKEAVKISAASQAGEAGVDQGYSTNAICRQFNCINPVIPAMLDLRRLNATSWQCQDHEVARPYLGFCKNAVLYSFSVPNPNASTELERVVNEQDSAASTAYFYHLTGMNLEPWQHRQPWKGTSSCAKAIWQTVCHTYFPRAEAGCKAGESTRYLRPCKNVCENYLSSCQVQCCDESVQCVFSKKVSLLDGNSTMVEGFEDELGPSARCTGGSGAASLGVSSSMLLLLAVFVKMMSEQK